MTPDRRRLSKLQARRKTLVATAKVRERLFVPTAGDAARAFDRCFATATGSTEPSSALTEAGYGSTDWRERVDLNEYEHGTTLLLPGDVLLGYSSREDIVTPPACEISLTAATSDAADAARKWLLDAGAPLLPFSITRTEMLEPPWFWEVWTSKGRTIRVSSMPPRIGSEPIHQIFVPSHQVGPFMGPETDSESDHPELVELIGSIAKELIGMEQAPSNGDFRFATRSDFDRVRAALHDRLVCS